MEEGGKLAPYSIERDQANLFRVYRFKWPRPCLVDDDGGGG